MSDCGVGVSDYGVVILDCGVGVSDWGRGVRLV